MDSHKQITPDLFLADYPEEDWELLVAAFRAIEMIPDAIVKIVADELGIDISVEKAKLVSNDAICMTEALARSKAARAGDCPPSDVWEN